ncbi:MAG: coenzyme F420-0:L-glutamate ligase, partial [Hydrogenoanaerobacterium sp.]
YLADNNFAELSGDALRSAITDYIKKRKTEEAVQAKASMETQGTTPRRLTDLLGSLCDLTTGSGDKGTPIVLIQGYFDKYVD